VVSQHTSEFYSDAAINFLYDQKNETQPFLALVCYNAPHDPRQSPKEFVDQYPVEQQSVPANYLPEHPFDQGDNRVRDELLAPFPRTEEAVQLHKSEYYAIISHMDREIGRILSALEQSDQADNTYVILTSDHGLAVGSHGLMGKQNQYDHSVRMPFIIRGPGLDGGKSIGKMIYMQSIYATVCELAGIGVPETVEYPSLVNLLEGEPEGGEEYVFGAYLDLQRMIRNKKYKLIVYPKVNEVQLFDLENDPDEMNDLAENKKYKSIKKDLFEAMKRKQEELGDFLVLDKI
jgi:choline-sulfatase